MSGGSIWEVVIQKRLNDVFWTNVWHVLGSDQPDALTTAGICLKIERDLHMEQVIFTSFRLSPYPGPGEGTVYPVNQPGFGGNAEYLPLFNVGRVDMTVATGRPSRKYFKFPVAESTVANGVFSETLRNSLNVNMATNLATAEGQIVDVDGQAITLMTLNPAVGMRQLRRGSKKRTTPVIPVA